MKHVEKFEYKIIGTIIPESSGFSTDSNVSYRLKYVLNGENFDVNWAISKSIVTAKILSDMSLADRIETILTLRNTVQSAIELQVGIFCVANAYGYQVVLNEIFSDVEGFRLPFTVDIEAIPKEIATEVSSKLHKAIFEIVGKYPDLVFSIKEALASYQKGILDCDSSALHFYRCVDCLKNILWRIQSGAFDLDDKHRKSAWELFNTFISENEKAILDELTIKAKNNRHGKIEPHTSLQRVTWSQLCRSTIIKILNLESLEQSSKE